MLFKLTTLLILSLATIRQAILTTKKQTSSEDNKLAYVLFPTMAMYLIMLGVI